MICGGWEVRLAAWRRKDKLLFEPKGCPGLHRTASCLWEVSVCSTQTFSGVGEAHRGSEGSLLSPSPLT